MEAIVLRDARPVMPHGLGALEAEARSIAMRNLTVLIGRWVDGSERYEAPGESLLVAIDPNSDEVIGVGGLGHCRDVPGALRMRRFYVAEAWRRRGVGRSLARELMARGAQHADTLTCNAGASAAAGPFWEAMGFQPVNSAGITHRFAITDTDALML